jgi:hypothetical protein
MENEPNPSENEEVHDLDDSDQEREAASESGHTQELSAMVRAANAVVDRRGHALFVGQDGERLYVRASREMHILDAIGLLVATECKLVYDLIGYKPTRRCKRTRQSDLPGENWADRLGVPVLMSMSANQLRFQLNSELMKQMFGSQEPSVADGSSGTTSASQAWDPENDEWIKLLRREKNPWILVYADSPHPDPADPRPCKIEHGDRLECLGLVTGARYSATPLLIQRQLTPGMAKLLEDTLGSIIDAWRVKPTHQFRMMGCLEFIRGGYQAWLLDHQNKPPEQ